MIRNSATYDVTHAVRHVTYVEVLRVIRDSSTYDVIHAVRHGRWIFTRTHDDRYDVTRGAALLPDDVNNFRVVVTRFPVDQRLKIIRLDDPV